MIKTASILYKPPAILSGLLLYCTAFPAYSQRDTGDVAVKTYIERFSDVAVREMMTSGIPASITLAQGIVESNAGRSILAREANNHFGIKCHSDWTGRTFIQDDDRKDECFRRYDSAEESYRDHSLFLSGRERYRELFRLDISDYRGWANGLKAAGYATHPEYASKLIGIIERYDLARFDRSGYAAESGTGGKVPETGQQKPVYELFAEGADHRMVYLNNGLQFTVLGKNDNIRSLASAFGVTEKKLRKWNDLRKETPFAEGQMIYLEPKKTRGEEKYHIVTTGETMYTIAQQNGIRLNSLYKKNHMKPGQKLFSGKKLLLQ